MDNVETWVYFQSALWSCLHLEEVQGWQLHRTGCEATCREFPSRQVKRWLLHGRPPTFGLTQVSRIRCGMLVLTLLPHVSSVSVCGCVCLFVHLLPGGCLSLRFERRVPFPMPAGWRYGLHCARLLTTLMDVRLLREQSFERCSARGSTRLCRLIALPISKASTSAAVGEDVTIVMPGRR